MPNLSTMLGFYKRKDIQQAMVESALNREVAVKYSDKGFGQRPDIIKYPNEVLDFVKQGATSFHTSEELWENPKLISPNLKKSDLEKLRKGWDLILDIDSPFWKIAKITAWLIIKGLQDLGISSVSIKFSGNKGFHIGVPFDSFPKIYNGTEIKNLFPEVPRNIAAFLLDYITEKYIDVDNNMNITFGKGLKKRFKISYPKLKELIEKNKEFEYVCPKCKRIGKSAKNKPVICPNCNLAMEKQDKEELIKEICSICKKEIKKTLKEKKVEFICPKCESSIKTSEDIQFKICEKCKVHMDKKELDMVSLCECGSNESFKKFNPLSIIEVDTILISSRHLFRMPYSFHEKSGRVSIPFNPEKILAFEKKFARPEIAKVSSHIFIDRKKAKKDEAKGLLEKAMEFGKEKEKKEDEIKTKTAFESLEEAIPEILFPPCMKKCFSGLQDGKKRATFILINFLKCVGWDYDLIEKRIREWNKKNPEPLRETTIVGQLRYHKRNKEKILPPNCDKQMYYKDMRVCMPDNFCKKIKNPINYAILKAKIGRKRK